MAKIDELNISTERKAILRAAGALRDLLLREPSPRCKELMRVIDDVASDFTGDREFFHTRGHRSP